MDGDGRWSRRATARGVDRQLSGASDGVPGGSNARGGPGSMDSQISSTSGGVGGSGTRCSTYVDIQEVDDIELLVKVRALPPISLPLKREISRAITELEGKYGAGIGLLLLILI